MKFDPTRKCRYCGNPVRHGFAVVCANPKCDRQRRHDNDARSQANREALGIISNRDPVFRSLLPTQKKEVMCLRCYKKFISPLTNIPGKHPVPVYRTCVDCRQANRELMTGSIL